MKNVILNNKFVRSVVLASSLAMSAFSANADLVLSFDKSDVEVKLNNTFTLGLYVDVTAQVDSILAWGLDLDFTDNSLLSLNNFTLGSDFSSIPGSDDGIAGASTSGPLFGNNILLGTFEFTAIAAGNTVASTSSNDPLFEGFTTTSLFTPSVFNSAFANISVKGDPQVSVSAPATLGLFSVALLGLFGLRRKA